MLTSISYLAVLVAALAHTIIGALWYSPLLFGAMWEKELKASMSKPRITDFLAEYGLGMIMAYFLALFSLTCPTFGVFQVALWAWLGFMVTVRVSTIIWAKASIKGVLIDLGALLVSMMVMATIIGLWR